MKLAASISSLAAAAGLGAVLFVTAGTTDWPAALAWVVLFAIAGVVGSWLLPEQILRERMRGPLRSNQTPADVAFVAGFGLVLLGWFVLMALDARRFEWSSVPTWLHVAGAVLFAVANVLATWVLRANPFASASVRVADGHTVATGGPYRVVRHPMYASVMLYVPGTALALGSVWGVAAVVAIAVALAVRITIEERTLRAGVPGYDDYAARVRWRLVPGLW